MPPGVDAVSLTGSVGAGLDVAGRRRACCARSISKWAATVPRWSRDADLNLVVAETLLGRMLMNGQACAATKKVGVEPPHPRRGRIRLDSALGSVSR